MATATAISNHEGTRLQQQRAAKEYGYSNSGPRRNAATATTIHKPRRNAVTATAGHKGTWLQQQQSKPRRNAVIATAGHEGTQPQQQQATKECGYSNSRPQRNVATAIAIRKPRMKAVTANSGPQRNGLQQQQYGNREGTR